MKVEKFEDIIAWQKAKELTILVYGIFRESRDFSFRDQLQRACVSIMNNTAEGFERKSDNEFKHFLFIAKGSCGEVRSMLSVALPLSYLTRAQYQELYALSIEISRLLSGFIKTL